MTEQAVQIDYTNHRGERSVRRVLPLAIKWEASEWHPRPQWVLEALDIDKQATRSFAMRDIHSWSPLI